MLNKVRELRPDYNNNEQIAASKTISALMIVTMSKNGNWTVFEYFSKELVCITDVGANGELRFPTLNAI